MNNVGLILQGSFPGGRPHSSVLLGGRNDYISLSESARTVQALMRHPNNITIQQAMNDFNRGSLKIQCYSAYNNVKTYPINVARLNFQNGGNPIDEEVLQLYECVFKTDLRNVRIHEGGREAETIGAVAFAMGKDIYFAEGMYNPHTPEGQRLLGHELTHVIQQKEGRVKNPFGKHLTAVYDPGLETEADRIGFQVYNRFNMLQLKNSPESNAVVQTSFRFKGCVGVSEAVLTKTNTATLKYNLLCNGEILAGSQTYQSGIGHNDDNRFYQSSCKKHAENDSEMKLVSWCMKQLIFTYKIGHGELDRITGIVEIVSSFGPCSGCRKAIRLFHEDLPGITITIRYNQDDKAFHAAKGGIYGYEEATGSKGNWRVVFGPSNTCGAVVEKQCSYESCCTSTTSTTATASAAAASANATTTTTTSASATMMDEPEKFKFNVDDKIPRSSCCSEAIFKEEGPHHKKDKRCPEWRRISNENIAAIMADASSQSQVITQRHPHQPPQQQLPPQQLPQQQQQDRQQSPQQRQPRVRKAKDSSWSCPCTIL